MIPRTPLARSPSAPPPSHRPRPQVPPPSYVPEPQITVRTGVRPPPAGVYDIPAAYTSGVIHFGIGVPMPGGETEVGDTTGGSSGPAGVYPQVPSSPGQAPAGVSPQEWLGPDTQPAVVLPQVQVPSQQPPSQEVSSSAGVFPQAEAPPGKAAPPTPEAPPKEKRPGVMRRPAAVRLPAAKPAGAIHPEAAPGSPSAPAKPRMSKWQAAKRRKDDALARVILDKLKENVIPSTAAQAAAAPTLPGQALSGTGFAAGSAVYEKLKETEKYLDCDVDLYTKRRYTSLARRQLL